MSIVTGERTAYILHILAVVCSADTPMHSRAHSLVIYNGRKTEYCSGCSLFYVVDNVIFVYCYPKIRLSAVFEHYLVNLKSREVVSTHSSAAHAVAYPALFIASSAGHNAGFNSDVVCPYSLVEAVIRSANLTLFLSVYGNFTLYVMLNSAKSCFRALNTDSSVNIGLFNAYGDSFLIVNYAVRITSYGSEFSAFNRYRLNVCSDYVDVINIVVVKHKRCFIRNVSVLIQKDYLVHRLAEMRTVAAAAIHVML